MTKSTFAPVFGESFIEACTPEMIQTAFRAYKAFLKALEKEIVPTSLQKYKLTRQLKEELTQDKLFHIWNKYTDAVQKQENANEHNIEVDALIADIVIEFIEEKQNEDVRNPRTSSIDVENTGLDENQEKIKLISTPDRGEKYLSDCSAMFHGLTHYATRRLAYEYATATQLKIPPIWEKNKIAGVDWFSSFFLARMTSFNRTTLKVFQDKLEEVCVRYSFEPSNIFNLDETGVTTVQRVPKVITKKGQHQIGQVTSRERGELVTQVGIIAANGISLPPIWVFPRQRFDAKRMMRGVPEVGPLGLVSPSGWMTSDNFIKVLEHIVKHSHCSIERTILLIMDNPESHLSVEGLDFCKQNGIVILTCPTCVLILPTSCSYLIEPCLGPLKHFSTTVLIHGC
ncbi:hypothetical protein MML48_9g00008280 [Holotrichia oblita]|uniref:Uncharacterized protein n=1 Tax=Holotrichia oblita TaxID=644536 RepID=A0ACB9SM93_HOLOL|nr:hypothetical protein MML48_9g00008280 [Holotrichia oblita]